ncbi:MAG: 30S ribosome-binding factor RbfA [bacterium]
MKAERLTRVNELLRREIGLQLFHALDPSAVDLSAITVTHVMISSDLHKARVLISVRGAPEVQNQTLYHLRHRHSAIQHLVAEHVVLKYTPRLHFFLDNSLSEGDHVLQILNDMDGSAANPDTPPES